MSENFDVLIDSDAFVGKTYKNDSHYSEANKIFSYIKQQKWTVVTTNLVVMETATVLSHREGQPIARRFITEMQQGGIPIIRVSEHLEREAYAIFTKQTKKGTSITDCANVAIMEHFQIHKIFSFDKVYPKTFNLEAVT